MGYKNALDRYIEATNSHDFANVRTWVDSNAVYWFSDKTCATPEEIQRYFENAWEMPLAFIRIIGKDTSMASLLPVRDAGRTSW